MVAVEYAKDHTIIKQGDDDIESFLFYIITEGSCSFVFEKDGICTKVGSAGVGDYFGERVRIRILCSSQSIDVCWLGAGEFR